MHNHRPSLKSFRMTEDDLYRIKLISEYADLSKTIIIRAAFNLGFEEAKKYNEDENIRAISFRIDKDAKVGGVSGVRITKNQELATISSRVFHVLDYSAACRFFIYFGSLHLLYKKVDYISKEDFINYALTKSFAEVR